MKYQPDVIFIGLPHSGSSFLRSYFSFHDEITWTRNGNHFMRTEFNPAIYSSLTPPKPAKVFIDAYELLAINFLYPPDTDQLERNRFLLNFDLSGQELAAYELIPSRIKKTLPDAKIIMVIRDQVSWLQSHYMYHIQNLPAGHRKFHDYMNCLDGKRVARAGLLHLTIKAYQEIFGEEKVHVLLLEQITQNLSQTLKTLCAFLGVAYLDFPQEKWDTHTGKPLISGRAIQALSNIGIPIGPIKKLSAIYRPIVDLGAKMVKPKVLRADEISLLQAFYSHSNVEASRLIKIKLADYGYPV